MGEFPVKAWISSSAELTDPQVKHELEWDGSCAPFQGNLACLHRV